MHPILMKTRRCPHNLRLRVPNNLPICVVCVCAEIDDSLNRESNGNRKLSSSCINNIIHEFRCINDVLDTPIEQNNIEKILPPLLRTSSAVLKTVDNDEVGTVVSQALDKICPRAPMYMLENFLEDLSAQILEKTSFGNLESLSVVIRRKECLNSFLKFHGSLLLPQLFQVLEKHAEHFSCFDRTTAAEINTAAGTSVSNMNNSLKVIEKLVEVLEANCSSDIVHFLSDRRNESSAIAACATAAFQIFVDHLKSIILSCMRLLNSVEITTKPAFPTKILSFLKRLFQHDDTLRCLGANNLNAPFCSMIKKLLFTRSVEVKCGALSVVHQMILTYMHTMEDENADKAHVADLPSVIFQVDLMHFITEAMNVSCGNLFRTALQVLDKISLIPVFQQGRMIPVLESILRISTIFTPENNNDMSIYEPLNSLITNIIRTLDPITPGIQFQLLHLFESLPQDWATLQFLPWVKLLCFCSEAELLRSLWSILITFVQRTKNVGSCYCVSFLKCVLLIVLAVINCKYSETLFVQDDAQVPRKDIMINKILSYVMDASMLPPLLTLITYGKSEDSIYVSILLELMMHFPVDHFKPFQAFGTQTQNVYKVIFDSETSGDVITRVNQDPEYEIEADADFLVNINGAWWWSSKCCFHLLASIRQNLEFVNSRRVFDLWNANISRIISCCYARYLPQFADVITLQQTNENGETHASQDVIRCILEKLDLTIQSWSKLVGKTVLESSSTTDSTSLQMHDITLAFYFFYVLFTGKEIFQLVDNLFVERLCTLLENCTEQHSLTQEVKDESMWIQTSFYYRIALVIASPLSQKYLSKLLDQFESMLLEVDESQQNFKNDVMTYQSSVFAFLLRHNVYSNYVSLVEMWAEVDKESCRSFYIDGKFDDELNTAVNNSLIALAAKGNLEISKLVVELADKRKAHKFSLDFNYVKTNMYGLIQKIPLDDDEGDEDPNNLERFSNVIQIAMKDQYLFCFEMQSPTDFLHHIIKVMLKFHNVSMIGKSCLELISKMLVNIRTLQNVNQYLTNHEQFIRFLGSQIGKLEKDVEETVFVFTLLASLIKHNLEKFTNNVNNQKSSWITWELTSVFSYIHRVPKLEILEFLLAIFKTNFKCPLIQIAELGLPSSDFGKILLNLLFHLQALLHKVAFQEPKEAIWEILYEILRHAEQGTGIQHSTFQTDVLFQPWMKVTMTFLLSQCVFPSAAPMMSLEFMRKWTKMILLYKVQNRSKRSPLQQTFLFQPYANVFKMIRNSMRKDPSQLPQEERLKSQIVSQTRLHVFDIERKSVCISEIVKTCEIFLASFQ